MTSTRPAGKAQGAARGGPSARSGAGGRAKGAPAARSGARAAGRPPFGRLLVANRGEIALRVIRACRELGVESVAVYSDADAEAQHVRAADHAVRIGPAPAGESYLRVEAIVEAARMTGAEAIHPGYGFLSERATFATACAAAGIAFVGPEASTLAGLGDKLAGRRAAAGVGVPVVPGTLEPAPVDRADQVEGILAAADRIGWPVLVKAAAGGGGRGMRRVERREDLPAALVAASREALAFFGDGSVYLERMLLRARHVEVQLLGDAQGALVAVGERDCSVQRRHQKLVEEAPAPGLEPGERRELHGLAVAVARAVGLRNAATCEFLRASDGRFWFLEVNARLQVEHGVTELVSGLDLVHEQLWIAAGEPLSERVIRVAELAATPERHAIEVRLSAEDPARGFAPVPGTLTAWREPGGPGVRVDGWVEAGVRIGSDYDPLMAKLLVVADDRGAALARLARALDEFEIAGLQTTLPFDRWLVRHPAFRAGDLATDFVARHWDGEAMRGEAARRAALAAIAAGTGGPPAGRTGRRPSGAVAPGDPGVEATVAPSLVGRDGGWPVAAPGLDWHSAGLREATDRWPG
ncbi:MAG: acetyl-CoA carboxylase biotin carboxylase subunit [Candidatus Limnocylindrales bacterium]